MADDATLALAAFCALARGRDAVAPMIAAPFELDLFDGEAWLGVVPFYMTNVAFRGTPSLPWISSFPELNVRTYVHGGSAGHLFLSLDAGRRLAVAAARHAVQLAVLRRLHDRGVPPSRPALSQCPPSKHTR